MTAEPQDLLRAARDHGVFAAPRGGVHVARAPGRLDVLGGVADYSGSRVLELPLREAAWAAVGAVGGAELTLLSVAPDGGERRAQLPVAALSRALERGLAACRALCAAQPWTAYVLGPLAALCEAGCPRPAGGLDVFVRSDVPEGAGVSSSAAVELAVAQAAAAQAGWEVAPLALARLCQRAENRVAGAPCGAMDQITVACARRGELLDIRCREPAEVLGSWPLPGGLGVVGIDSGVRHAVSGDPYGDARAAAFMGRRILQQRGVLRPGEALCTLEPAELARHDDALPERMGGAGFLATYGGIDDDVARVHAGRDYPVRAATRFGVAENARVAALVDGLQRRRAGGDDAALGELLYASHAGYSACGLGSAATDALVDRVRHAGPERGLLGARVSGGGSGGTVAVLVRQGALAAVAEIAAAHRAATGAGGRVFAASSDGAAAHGVTVHPPAEDGR